MVIVPGMVRQRLDTPYPCENLYVIAGEPLPGRGEPCGSWSDAGRFHDQVLLCLYKYKNYCDTLARQVLPFFNSRGQFTYGKTKTVDVTM